MSDLVNGKRANLRRKLVSLLLTTAITIAPLPLSAENQSLPSLDGRSFHGEIRARGGWLGLFKGRTTLTFKDGMLISTSDDPPLSLPYHVSEENGRIIFTAEGPTDYDGGTIKWTGTVDGETLRGAHADWIRGTEGTVFHDLLLPDVVTWVFTPDPIREPEDGSEMALIPGGTFEMGRADGQPHYDNVPVHTVKIDSFYMDRYEVTVAEFNQFLQETGYEFDYGWWEKYFVSPSDDHPMVHVNWHDAAAYAKWRGKRLPTEAEWEYAARGGLEGKRYPWGDIITRDDANFHRYWKDDDEYGKKYTRKSGRDGWRYSTAPVGNFAPNGYGLYDMAGNASEWCQDWYQRDYYRTSPTDNPQGPKTGSEKVSRGGHWYSWHKGLRIYNRGSNPPDVERWQDVQGFRCARDLK